MKTALNVGRIGGVTISIHWTFLLILLWIIFVNWADVFRTEALIWSLLLLLSIFASVLIHELAHALAAGYFGIRAPDVVLLPSGGVANMPRLPKMTGKELLIIIAGPLANLLIGLLLKQFIHPYSAYWNTPENIGLTTRSNFLFQLQVINMSLALFNLIPAFPLDGGRILKILLALKTNRIKAARITGMISYIIGYGLVFFGIINMKLLLVLAGSFIIFAVPAEEYFVHLKPMAFRSRSKQIKHHPNLKRYGTENR